MAIGVLAWAHFPSLTVQCQSLSLLPRQSCSFPQSLHSSLPVGWAVGDLPGVGGGFLEIVLIQNLVCYN